jgi:hypothetical protein
VQDQLVHLDEMEQTALLAFRDLLDHLARMEIQDPTDTEEKRDIEVKKASKGNRGKLELREHKELKVFREYRASRVKKECKERKVNEEMTVTMEQMGHRVMMVYRGSKDRKVKQVMYIDICGYNIIWV